MIFRRNPRTHILTRSQQSLIAMQKVWRLENNREPSAGGHSFYEDAEHNTRT